MNGVNTNRTRHIALTFVVLQNEVRLTFSTFELYNQSCTFLLVVWLYRVVL